MDRDDVGMIEGGCGARFPLEAFQALRVRRERLFSQPGERQYGIFKSGAS